MSSRSLGLISFAVLVLAVACTGRGDEKDEASKAGVGAPPDVEAPAAEPEPTRPDLPPPYNGDPVSTSTTENGVVISDYVVGDGAEVEAGMDVAVHYSGYLVDGLRFDSSLDKRRPYSFTVGQGKVIDGWDEGILGMKVGGQRLLEVPPELGYGSKKAGKIPPNSRLWFTMALEAAYPPVGAPRGDEAFEGKPLSKQKLDGGLVIEVYAEGEGEPAKKGDVVLVHYTGRLKDGTVFDSSVSDPKPITFPLGIGKVIDGWERGLEGMKVGELRRLRIPAELGYGAQGKKKIPANSDLVFTVELMAIR